MYGKGLTIGLQVESIETVRLDLMKVRLSPSEIKNVGGQKRFISMTLKETELSSG